MSIFLSPGNYSYFTFATAPVYSVTIYIKRSRSFIVNLNEVNSSIYPTLEVISILRGAHGQSGRAFYTAKTHFTMVGNIVSFISGSMPRAISLDFIVAAGADCYGNAINSSLSLFYVLSGTCRVETSAS